MVPNKVVPAFPYEGALYWLFSEKKAEAYQGQNDYYATLYGVNYGVAHDRIVPKASALACLFDEIVMTPADARMPNDSSLRVSIGGDYLEWSDEVKGLAEELLRNSPVQALIAKTPYFADDQARRHFLCRTIAQMIIADRNSAVLVGNSFFAQVYNEVAKEIGRIHIASQSTTAWMLDLELLSITGLEFGSGDMDTFAAVRQSKEISEYASDFRSAIGKAASSPDLKGELLNLMKQALEQETIAKYASGAFETIGSVANVVGLIPVVGNIASALGIAADILDRGAEARETKKQWYLIGPKMKEVALKEIISRS